MFWLTITTKTPDPIAHINFSQNIDLLLMVPVTANILAKFANGIADDFLTSTYLASNPVLMCAGDEYGMWNIRHPEKPRNTQKDGVLFVEPVSGDWLAKRSEPENLKMLKISRSRLFSY